MTTVYEIIQGINQAAANGAWDGAHEESLQADGKARDAGLKRQEGHYINDRRVMDGFQVKFHGPVLRLSYQEIVKFLKKEYKAITGNTLALTKMGEHHVLVQRISNYRTDCQAHCDYRIGGLNDVVGIHATSDDDADEHSKDRLDKTVRDFLSQGRKESTYAGGKVGKTRPKNDTRKGK